ncbi:MAG TPA: isoprenylcysteine carboxylmethyltransferase family protein [Vicinamibacterales bacterium]|nr:isoprenylcysteine carboxylmethyltransferase family protein [Vicinamibacterales bacterium]
MTLPGSVIHWLFTLAAAGAVLFFFIGLPSYLERRPDRPLWVRGIHDLSLLLALAHVTGAFLLQPRSDNFAAAGIVMYTASVTLFLSAMDAARGTRLQRAFIDHPLPDRLITTGPYRWVRHPFYLGYVIGALAPSIAIDNVWITLISAVMIAISLSAAVREERVWLSGPRADAYREYRRRTGMFVPRMPRRAASIDPTG